MTEHGGAPAERLLVMLAKPPDAGRVKTRLTVPGGLSPAEAASFAAACVGDLAHRFGADPRWRMAICHPAGAAAEPLRALLPARVELWPEPNGASEFGAVMHEVIAARLRDGYRKVLLIGSDCPQLPAARVEAAFTALMGRDLVLGPDDGGGCYLIGARCPLPLLTASDPDGPIAWSRGTDYRALVRRAAARGKSVAHLAPEYDIDHPADLRRLAAEVRDGRIPAARLPRVAAWLSSWGGGWTGEGPCRSS